MTLIRVKTHEISKVLNISYSTLLKMPQLLTVTVSSHLFRSGRFIDLDILAHKSIDGLDKREFILVFQPVPFAFFFSAFFQISSQWRCKQDLPARPRNI
jgi:hypothetical protein